VNSDIRTDVDTGTHTEWITLTTAEGPMRVFAASPRGAAPGRAVVVLQEAFGVNDHIQQVTRRLAGRGFLALAPDLFHRTGTAELPYSDHARGMELIGAIGPNEITADVTAVLGHLAARGIPAGRTALAGFCFGGRAAFTAATAVKGLAGVVVFYGPGIAAGPHAVLDRAAAVDAPLLMHTGEDDPTIPAEHVRAIDAALDAAGVPYRHCVHPGAGHAFACDARPDKYRPEPARRAWEMTYAFLDEHLPA
jgi:carboxymethylenebutenolidase